MIERVVLKPGQVRWRVRYRTPDYRYRSRTFDRRRDADEFGGEQRRAIRQGTFVDPARGRLTLQAL